MTTRVRLRDNPTAVSLLWVIGVVTLAGSAAVAITLGPAGLSVGEVTSIVVGHLGGTAADVTPIRDGIVWDLRLPRTLLAALCGAGLGLCGAIMQSLLRNPLADPFVLGISSGASTGAVLIVILGVGSGVIGLSSGAFIGAVISFALVLLLAHAAGGTPDRVILAGVAATQLFSALTSFIVITSADPEQTRGVMFWLLGSLGGADWLDVALCAAVVAVGLVVCLTHSRALDAFAFGEDAAASLGVNVWRVRVTLLLATALMTAVIVSVAGAIGFVGLVLPHAARALVGSNHRRLLPASALIGSIFLVWVDAVARTAIAPQELPAGVVTALVGVPAFAVILWRRKARP
ncbi:MULTISPECIES: iron chelate uptake ABC transporter family permease subunit [Rhodococcus]|jgi:iron complex transport system permease protein|uniref:FecCD family ABC transporter permease n=2 Tax=Actinomycetes TaxID=1760 RepID=A0ABV5XBB4_9NOCA|nr:MULTISPECIES: iron chelate uptake ABC transporter family permease subunit [Rhodococcus]NHP17612.1 iron chelate uptake ABC transporter family permease subunit [Rhodococcus sp. IC4_135]MBJ7481789.1 iron chelate uptake ABC transporter family permease subunit [Rhodococcus sp. (in: high G+C Gram-positive bacteria)]MDI9960008.1 iron chelate uptake ABC transporter family permease subunit [Rhodococcus sp. IEGM 1237]MDI9965869.1 iron chelate uptake ABC transporter family permease subunit [Rhodococcus